MFRLITDHPVALESWDHKIPCGVVTDNHRNQKFNDKVYHLFGVRKPLYILDLGCAGGGMVKNFIEDGHLAVGLEGCDVNLKTKRAEWATIPDNLFTCDCTKRFRVVRENPEWFDGLPIPVYFDVITAWEFMEHIEKYDLFQVFENVRKHLKPEGLFFMSIALFDSGPYHRTVENRAWWYDTLEKHGFVIVDDLCDRNFFRQDEWIRCDEPLDRRAQIVVKKLV